MRATKKYIRKCVKSLLLLLLFFFSFFSFFFSGEFQWTVFLKRHATSLQYIILCAGFWHKLFLNGITLIVQIILIVLSTPKLKELLKQCYAKPLD